MEAIELIIKYSVKLDNDILFYGTYEECRRYMRSSNNEKINLASIIII